MAQKFCDLEINEVARLKAMEVENWLESLYIGFQKRLFSFILNFNHLTIFSNVGKNREGI